MANTSPVYARIDSNLKTNAESILSQLGITPSGVIQMLYSQIVLHRGIPFELRVPARCPVAAGSLTQDKLNEELEKGIKSLKEDRGISADDVDLCLKREFDV